MKNIAKSAIVAAAIAITASASIAQSDNFEGFSAGINLNLVGGSTQITSGSTSIKMGENSNNVALQGAYGVNFGGGVVSFGGTYNMGEMAGGTINAGTYLYKLRMKNMYSAYIEPGMVVGKTLVYGKLAYLSGQGEESLNANSGTETFTGTGFGVGSRTFLDNKMYVQVEFLQNDFAEKTVGTGKYKPASTIATIGVGVKF
jgi:hypothetical protein